MVLWGWCWFCFARRSFPSSARPTQIADGTGAARAGIPTAVDAGAASAKALNSQWLKRYVPAVSSKRYVEECKFVADRIANSLLQ